MLNPRRANFVEEFLRDQNATYAAIRCGYAASSASRMGHKLRHHPDFAPRIEEALAQRQESIGADAGDVQQTREDIVRELRQLAFSNPKRLVYWEGDKLKLRKFEEVSDEEAASISEISMTRTGLRVKFRNKESALAEMRRAVAPRALAAEATYPFDLGNLSHQEASTFARLFPAACPSALTDPRGAGRYWEKV
jgi:phage terminase small subunit